MADLFREIDEELRAQQLATLWKKYGKFIIAALVIVIAVVAVTMGWRSYRDAQREKDSAKFGAALELLSDNKTPDAIKAFSELEAKGTPGYAYLSGLQEAQAEIGLGHQDKAVAIYQSLAAKNVADPFLADYAELLAIMHSVNSGLDPNMSKRLDALAVNGKPWALIAQQLQAMADLKAGRAKDAQAILVALSENVDAPQSIRDRAQELAAVIGAQK